MVDAGFWSPIELEFVNVVCAEAGPANHARGAATIDTPAQTAKTFAHRRLATAVKYLNRLPLVFERA